MQTTPGNTGQGRSKAQADAYLRTRVLSASPAELRLLLIEGAIRFATQAKEGLDKRDYELSFAGFSQCRDIIAELIRSVGPGAPAELAERVQAVYTFLFKEMVDASLQRDAARVAKVIELLEFERETWVQFMERLRAEQAAAPQAAVATPAPDAVATAGTRQPFSLSA